MRRITLLFAGSGGGEATHRALELLAWLGARPPTELHGLFVEDDDLLRLAELPFTRELCRLTYTERHLQPADIERHFRIQARTARQALETAAGRAGLAWTFRTHRGAETTLLEEALREADLLILPPGRSGATALPRPATLAGLARQSRGPVTALFDGSEAARRALRIARRLAEVGRRELVVVLDGAEAARRAELRREAEALVQGGPVHYRVAEATDDDGLLVACTGRGAGTLVAGSGHRLLAPARLETLRLRFDGPLLLVR